MKNILFDIYKHYNYLNPVLGSKRMKFILNLFEEILGKLQTADGEQVTKTATF